MSEPLTNFAPLYNWSLIERGLQSYFAGQSGFEAPPTDYTMHEWTPASGNAAVITAFEANIFQQARPRLVIDLNDIAPPQPAKQVSDANAMLRPWHYRANMRLGIVTAADYTAHVALRSTVASLADTIAPMMPSGTGSTVGVNPLLANHAITSVINSGQSTTITPEDGYYISQLNYVITFAVRHDVWPGGLTT